MYDGYIVSQHHRVYKNKTFVLRPKTGADLNDRACIPGRVKRRTGNETRKGVLINDVATNYGI